MVWLQSPWLALGRALIFSSDFVGFAAGAASGSRSIASDPESKARIETAFRRFRADVLRREADALDKGEKRIVSDLMF